MTRTWFKLPADDRQAVDLQILDGHIARDEGRAKRAGVSRNHDIKCPRTSTEALSTGTNPGVRLRRLADPRRGSIPALKRARRS